VCQAGAREVLTEILQRNPSESVAVFAVWFAVLGPDSSSQVNSSLLDDARVIQYWDSDGDVSAFLTENADQLDLPAEGLFWDAYLLFGPDADWEEIPTDLIAWGAPVVTNIDGLTKQLDDLWAGG
jgi:hypothetical protein